MVGFGAYESGQCKWFFQQGSEYTMSSRVAHVASAHGCRRHSWKLPIRSREYRSGQLDRDLVACCLQRKNQLVFVGWRGRSPCLARLEIHFCFVDILAAECTLVSSLKQDALECDNVNKYMDIQVLKGWLVTGDGHRVVWCLTISLQTLSSSCILLRVSTELSNDISYLNY